MSISMSEAKISNASEQIEISLVDIIRMIWSDRKFIVICTISIVVMFLGLTFSLAKYKSESFYYFYHSVRPLFGNVADDRRGLREDVYDRIMNSAKKLMRFDEYLKIMRLTQAPEAVMLREKFMSSEGIVGSILPIDYSQFSPSVLRGDMRTLGGDMNENLLGLKIELSAHDAELVYRAVAVLTNYLMDIFVYEMTHDGLVGNFNDYLVRGEKIENELTALSIRRPHIIRKIGQIEILIEKYAKLFESNIQTEMRMTTETSLNSSPIGKLMELQLELANLDERTERLQRELQQADLYRTFYARVLKSIEESRNADIFMSDLPSIFQKIFSDMDVNDEVVREVFNELSVKINDMNNLHKENIRLIIQPTMPTKRTIKPGLALVGTGAFLFGLFLSIMIVLGKMWWRKVSEWTECLLV